MKQIRDLAVMMKSPLKEMDNNALRLSPIKFRTHVPPSPSPTKPQKVELLPEPHNDDNANPFHKVPANVSSESKEEVLRPIMIPVIDDSQSDYNASAEQISFQEIRTAIRKSIVQKSKPTPGELSSSESSFKSADETPQPSSMVVNPTSSIHTKQDGEENISVETVKVPLKDETDRKKSFVSNTPPPPKRESQGFALLPHREPLAMKSTKKKPIDKLPSNLGDSDYHQTAHVPKVSLYPTLSLETSNSPTVNISSLEKIPKDASTASQVEPNTVLTSSKIPKLAPSELNSPIHTRKQVSPSKIQKSPFSNLFASVNSTLKRARSKFISETQHVVYSPEKTSISRVSPQKTKRDHATKVKQWSRNDKEVELITRLNVPTHSSQSKGKSISPKKNEAQVKSPQKLTIKSPQKVVKSLEQSSTSRLQTDLVHQESRNEDGRSSSKFSPVKSIYGSLRKEMNESIKLSPVKPSEKENVQRNLTRMSLTKHDENNPPPRKSLARTGLTGISLEAKTKGRPKSLVGDQLVRPLKRKTQTEDEVKSINTSQAYRKIGTKIVAPSTLQTKNHQDVKRRRTAEQIQQVLQKRASRVSQTGTKAPSVVREESAMKPLKPVAKYPTSTNQNLMKTAMLQHARMNNEGKANNPFQTGSSFDEASFPSTPKPAGSELPEIFSESDDDEEGSVLKDWANSPELKQILINQQHIDPDKVFGPVAPLQMEEIFHASKSVSKFKHRGSSAQWTRDGLTTQEVDNYKNRVLRR